jgi:hypothetical protein
MHASVGVRPSRARRASSRRNVSDAITVPARCGRTCMRGAGAVRVDVRTADLTVLVKGLLAGIHDTSGGARRHGQPLAGHSLRRSLRGVATVDRQRHAGHQARRRAGEPQHRCRASRGWLDCHGRVLSVGVGRVGRCGQSVGVSRSVAATAWSVSIGEGTNSTSLRAGTDLAWTAWTTEPRARSS